MIIQRPELSFLQLAGNVTRHLGTTGVSETKERIDGCFLSSVRSTVPVELTHLQVVGNFSWVVEI